MENNLKNKKKKSYRKHFFLAEINLKNSRLVERVRRDGDSPSVGSALPRRSSMLLTFGGGRYWRVKHWE